MPVLATMLLNIFVGFIEWLAKFISQKVAVALALVTVLTLLFTALYASLNVVIASAMISLDGVHPMFGVGIAMIISPHAAALFASYITFWSVIELYKWKVSLVSVWSRTI